MTGLGSSRTGHHLTAFSESHDYVIEIDSLTLACHARDRWIERELEYDIRISRKLTNIDPDLPPSGVFKEFLNQLVRLLPNRR